MKRFSFFIAFMFIFLCTAVILPAEAQEEAGGLSVDIRGPGYTKMNIVLGQSFSAGGGSAMSGQATTLRENIRSNLTLMPFLGVVPEGKVLGGSGAVRGPKAEEIDFQPFTMSKIDLLITMNWVPGPNLGSVELRCYEVYSQKLLLGKGYDAVTKDQIPVIADRFCMELMALLTGKGDFFQSRIAFVRPSGRGKDIYIASPTGRDVVRATSFGDLGMALSPAWSPDGRSIAFTLIGSRSHHLGIWSGGKPKVYTLPSSAVISPSYMPSGTLAVAVNPKGGRNTDIYTVSGSRLGKALVSGSAIEVSPSFDSSGQVMAYVSDKSGGPNIYVRSGGSERRVSSSGYNTNPTVSPDGKFVAYSKAAGGGHKIFLADLETGQERQLTSGAGSDEHPSFSPDSYYIAFSSTRGGGSKIYITTINGDGPIPLPIGGGSAYMPSFSPVPAK